MSEYNHNTEKDKHLQYSRAPKIRTGFLPLLPPTRLVGIIYVCVYLFIVYILSTFYNTHRKSLLNILILVLRKIHKVEKKWVPTF